MDELGLRSFISTLASISKLHYGDISTTDALQSLLTVTAAEIGSDRGTELWYVILLCTEAWSKEDVVVMGLALWEEPLRLAEVMAGVA